MPNENHTDDIQEELRESNGFCILQVRAKLGSGTCDSERITATLGRDALEEIEDEREDLLAMVRETIEDVRTMQPEDGENDEEENE